LEKACKQHHLGLQLEFSGPRISQRNGKLERKVQTLYGGIRAMLNDSGLVDEIRDGLWAECASKASFYKQRIINKETQQSPLQLMTTKYSIQGKLNDRGTGGLSA
jgi:hypothetical protein